MQLVSGLVTEIGHTLANGQVWLSVAEGIALFLVCTAIGVWIARSVGILSPDAPAGETIGVGLAVGLLVLSAWIALIGSGGGSAFTPVAVGFLIAVLLGASRFPRQRKPMTTAGKGDGAETLARRGGLLIAIGGGAIFIVAVAIIYGSTMALSARGGVQPLEFMDEAFYSVLASDIGRTGKELILWPSGFVDIPGIPEQNWYHWGEIWFASAAIKMFGAAPIAVRHFMVLPILLLACTTLTGTLVRRINRTNATGAFVVGFAACLFLAPVPWLAGSYFASWAVGLIFGITVYGLAAVAVLLALHTVLARKVNNDSWAYAVFAGTMFGSILPAHVVIAALASLGGAIFLGLRALRRYLFKQHVVIVPASWHRTIICAGLVIIATVFWGLFTGHGVPASALSTGVAPFNESWQRSIVSVLLGAGSFYAIAFACIANRSRRPAIADGYIAIAAMLGLAALAWGARLGDFNMFHVFFGAVAVFATPAAAMAMWYAWERVRATRGTIFTAIIALLFVAQLDVGFFLGVLRLQQFGPGYYAPVPVQLLDVIRGLPEDAKIAYSCGTTEEISYWVPRLLSIGVHTDRRIIPLCFEADYFAYLAGSELSADVESPLFRTAPQRSLYPASSAKPSSQAVAAFLTAKGIDYIYADDAHPNILVPGATRIASIDGFELLRVH